MTDAKVPTNNKAITPEWLTSFLQTSSLLPKDLVVTSIDKSSVEGGFNSTVTRLKVSYSGQTTAPSSFIIKFAQARGADTSSEKELYFFQNVERLGLPPPFRAPKVYIAVKSGRTYVFLLEDLGNLRHYKQKDGGADYVTARQMAVALATFHGKYWNSAPDAFQKTSEAFCPLADQEAFYKAIQGYAEMSLADFDTLNEDEPEISKIAKFCASNLADLVKAARKPPCTLLHGDARLSNYFFEGDQGVVAVDWQGLNVGSGPGELAYFICMSVRPDVRQQHEADLVHLYYDTLVKTGAVKADEFPYQACFQKYLLGVATSAAVPILTARGVIEGKKFLDKPPSNPAMADHAKVQIAMHDNIKPMIDAWCATARSHPIQSIKLDNIV